MKKFITPPQVSLIEFHEAVPIATSSGYIESLIEEEEFNGWTTN